jgi:uncharacterized protein with ATP-grasp and redox domains
MLNLVLKAGKLCGLTEEQFKEVMNYALDELRSDGDELFPPILTGRIYEYMHKKFFAGAPVFDPYRQLKQQTTAEALEHLDRLRTLVATTRPCFHTALRVSAAGNVIDFGAANHNSFNIEREIEAIPALQFAFFDAQELHLQLKSGQRLLFVTDNAGETVFDRVLLEVLRTDYPHLDVVIAVHERPILNDAVMQDALQAGLDRIGRLISSGSIYPGTVLSESSAEFLYEWKRADIIIGKGQGNFETLCEQVTPKLFFILRIKCSSVAGQLGAPIGALVLRQWMPRAAS